MPSPVFMASPASPTATTTTKSALLVTALVAPVSVSVTSVSAVSEGPIIVVVEMIAFSKYTLIVVFLVHLDGRFLQIFLPFWVSALLAISTIRTETRQEVRTHLLSHVFLGASWAQWTKALIVMWAGRQFALGIDVQVKAFVSVAAKAVSQEKVALGHLTQVEFVQKLAGLALLAKASQPMFANKRIERVTAAAFLLRDIVGGRRDVPLGAARA